MSDIIDAPVESATEELSQKKHDIAQIQLNAIINNMKGGVALIELGEKIRPLFLSHRFKKMFGISSEQALSKAEDLLSTIDRRDHERLKNDIMLHIKTNISLSGEYRAAPVPGESTRWISIQGSRIEYPDSRYPVAVVVIYDISEQKRNREMLIWNAEHDILTGIYNKNAFYRLAAEIFGIGRLKYYIVVWNIERFKLINDIYGHVMGDRVLKLMATEAEGIALSGGVCGRLEGDRFAFCLPVNSFDPNDFVAATARISAELSFKPELSSDIGIFEIDDIYLPVDAMCDRAVLALNTVKGNYNRHCAYYDSSLREAMLLEQQIRDDMERALAEKQFSIYFHPIHSISHDSTIAAEVLIRWIHPEKGVIPPSVFIPVFEKNGFIDKIDLYIWEKVCAYQSERKKRGAPMLPFSVNFSRVSLHNPALCDIIYDIACKYGVEPLYLHPEITETAYNDNPEQMIETVKKMREKGFEVLMDDFGSGYSSLTTLKDIPVSVLKLDMQFMSGFENGGRVGTIVTSIVLMAKRLGLKVIAEGVETAEQNEFLASIGCDNIQGYYYARPMTAEEFDKYLSDPTKVSRLRELSGLSNDEMELLLGGSRVITAMMESMYCAFGIYERNGDRLELLRVNAKYYDTVLSSSYSDNAIMNLVEADRNKLLNALDEARASEATVQRTLHRLSENGFVTPFDCKIRCIGRDGDRCIYCIGFIKS